MSQVLGRDSEQVSRSENKPRLHLWLPSVSSIGIINGQARYKGLSVKASVWVAAYEPLHHSTALHVLLDA